MRSSPFSASPLAKYPRTNSPYGLNAIRPLVDPLVGVFSPLLPPLPKPAPSRCRMVSVSPLPLADDANNCAKMRLLGLYGRQFIRLCTLPPATIPFVFTLLSY